MDSRTLTGVHCTRAAALNHNIVVVGEAGSELCGRKPAASDAGPGVGGASFVKVCVSISEADRADFCAECSPTCRRPRSFGCGRWSTSTTSSAPSTSASGSKPVVMYVMMYNIGDY